MDDLFKNMDFFMWGIGVGGAIGLVGIMVIIDAHFKSDDAKDEVGKRIIMLGSIMVLASTIGYFWKGVF